LALALVSATTAFCAMSAAGIAAPSRNVNASQETAERVMIAAASMQDALVIDCQLPGRLMQLGGMRTYLTPGRLLRLSAIDCKTRGGEYTVGDLSSGTLSLQRWLPLAQQGQAEAQYYVARIYANGMGIPADYAQAAVWYQKAADQHYSSALQELGYLYEKGLGVPQDALKALNLQRQGSGLGQDLDYAWKITATKEEAAKQLAEMSGRLEASNLELESLQAQYTAVSDKLSRSSERLEESENAVLGLRAQLQAARAGAADADGTRVKALEKQLAENQQKLSENQTDLAKARAELAEQQASLSSRLSKSQAASLELNELLAARQSENNSLRARLAQSEQRLIRSQQELSDLRLGYRHEVEELAEAHDELGQIKSKSKTDGGASLLAAKQREIDRQQIRIQSLESELNKMQQTKADNPSPQTDVALLRSRVAQQTQLLQTQRQELDALRSKSQEERAAVLKQMSDQLNARTAELESKQRRIASLEADANSLRVEVSHIRDERSRESKDALSEAERLREQLRQAQQKLADQRDQLDRLKTESAAERAALIKDRDNLQAATANDQGEAAVLKAQIQARELTIAAKQKRIADLERELASKPAPVVAAANVTYRNPISSDLRSLSPPEPYSYHALIIGNTHYQYLGGLETPANDAKDIAELLERRYGFKVTLLLDATSDQIMMGLHEYAMKMTQTDRLLIYYAGHGGTKNGPPDRAFWLGVDANPDTERGFISAEAIKDKIKQMNAMHVLLVADSCFSASITHLTTTSVGPKPGMDAHKFQVQWNRPARMVLTSGQNTPVVDSMGDSRHSLFAKYFIQILRQNDNVVSGQMLSYELNSRIAAAAARMGLNQAPTYTNLQDANHQFGDFFFVPAAPAMRVAALIP
jgi:hypothetical protein